MQRQYIPENQRCLLSGRFQEKFVDLWSSKMGFAGGLVEGICLPMQKMKERQVQSLDRKDTLEEETATHSNILGYKIPRTEEPGWLQSIELQRLRHD